MLEKITNQIFVEKKMKKMLKISKIAFFIGVATAIAFPLLSKNIKIEEKQLRNTSLFARKIDNSQFTSYFKTYFYEPNYQDDIYNFCTSIFRNTSNIPYNKIFTKNILSPRGKKIHLIQINLIYDKFNNLENTKNTNFVFYALMKFLSEKKNIHWLAKDIQINYVTKELFDEKPKECYELLTSAKYNQRVEQGKIIHAIYNFDLSEIDLDNLNTFLIKIVGINSEHVDIDFYKMVVSNFQTNFNNNKDFKITTHETVLSDTVKKNILFVLNTFNDIIKNFFNKVDYKNKYIYIIQDIINDYFLINNKITTNNLLITNSFNSMLIKTTGKYIYNSKERKYTSYYNLLGTIILMIKGMNTEEIDIFRGLYFYIFSSPYQCIEYTYLFILILMTLRGFFHLIELIYHNEYKFIWINNNIEQINNEEGNNYIHASRIISALFAMGIVYILLVINFEKFMELINFNDLIYTYYFLIGNIFMNQIFVLTLLNLSKSEEKFINIIVMYLQILNCWNFVFINVGIGLTMTVILMSMEFIFLHLTLVKYCTIKIGIICALLFGIMSWKDLINTMVSNYIKFNNNVYIIITTTVVILTLRLALFIVMIMNKFFRQESWDFDEIEIFDEYEEDNKEIINQKEKEKENEVKEIKNENIEEINEDNNKEEIMEYHIEEIKEIKEDNNNEENKEDNNNEEIKEVNNVVEIKEDINNDKEDIMEYHIEEIKVIKEDDDSEENKEEKKDEINEEIKEEIKENKKDNDSDSEENIIEIVREDIIVEDNPENK